jgi:porin
LARSLGGGVQVAARLGNDARERCTGTGPRTPRRRNTCTKRICNRAAAYAVAGLLPITTAAFARSDQPAATAPTAAGAEPAPSSLAAYDAALRFKGWEIPFPSFDDTLTQDYAGWRSTLAKSGIGLITTNSQAVFDNVLAHPASVNGQQVYVGQRPTYSNATVSYLTIDLARHGVPDGQIVVSGTSTHATWDRLVPDTLSLAHLTYYQTFLNRAVEFKIGYDSNGYAFIGQPIGGSSTGGIIGPSASIPVELGLSVVPAPAPSTNTTFHFSSEFYDKVGLQRSLSPTPIAIVDDKRKNPSGFELTEPGAGLLVINETGYQRPARPGTPQTWVRGGFMYNTSAYHDYRTDGTDTNHAFYLLGDRQLRQFDPSSPRPAYQGIYAGLSAMYAAPDTNIVSQYYEARLYAFGLFPGRPDDLASVVVAHSRFSPYAGDRINAASAKTATFARSDTTTLTFSYSAHLRPGVHLTPAISYTDHPSFAYVANEGSALTAQMVLSLLF